MLKVQQHAVKQVFVSAENSVYRICIRQMCCWPNCRATHYRQENKSVFSQTSMSLKSSNSSKTISVQCGLGKFKCVVNLEPDTQDQMVLESRCGICNNRHVIGFVQYETTYVAARMLNNIQVNHIFQYRHQAVCVTVAELGN